MPGNRPRRLLPGPALLDRSRRGAAFGLDAPPQGVHEIDDLGRSVLLARLDFLALLFSAQQPPRLTTP